MNDKAHVWIVKAHTQRRRGHDDGRCFAADPVLDDRRLVRLRSRLGTVRCTAEHLGEARDELLGGAIDNDAIPLAIPDIGARPTLVHYANSVVAGHA